MTSRRRALAVVATILGACFLVQGSPGHAAVTAGPAAPAGGRARAVFALILGVNASPEPEVPPLQYADDDAARYLELFRALNARTYVLSRLDANTRRLHPQAEAEALPPRRAELQRAVEALARDIGLARARGMQSTLYLVYAGHGEVRDSDWYLTLEDDRLSGRQLMSQVIDRAGADQTHVIIDACQAYLLAAARGPGGTRRPIEGGFVEMEAAARAGRVGYLLSSSASGESHEWAGFEAGVFSHEVRSGLYGAADADGDGRVTYAEIAAFVARANQGIANERFRPQVLARAPQRDDVLLDLRGHRTRELLMEGPEGAAHYLLENEDGVRLLDFHGDGVTPVRLLSPAGDGLLYLRRLADGGERTVLRTDGVVSLAALPVSPAHAAVRGAAHNAFNHTFSLAFTADAVAQWSAEDARVQAARAAETRSDEDEARSAHRRRILGWSALGTAVAATAVATGLELSARNLSSDAPPYESQRDTMARNDRIDLRNHLAVGFAAGALAAGAAGVMLLLWPGHTWTALPVAGSPRVDVAVSAQGGGLHARWQF